MSSILDALKKAEQESTTDRYSPTPWPPPAPLTDRDNTHRWWVLFGLVVVLGVGVGIVWQIRQPDTRRPAASSTTAAPLVAQNSKPDAPLPPKERQASAAISDQTPPVAAPPVQPKKAPPSTPIPAAGPKVQPPPPTTEMARQQPIDSKPEPETAPAELPKRRPAPRMESTRQPAATDPDSAKTFRSDSRIELQALVWASEAAERFVVINNRLVKEGGAVDNIVVVQINRDDVLLSEGSNRWHEKFKIH